MSVATANLAPGDPIAEGRSALFGGDAAGAAELFQAAGRADPAEYESRYWLSSALTAAGAHDAARQALDDARTLHAIAAIRGADYDMQRFQADRGYCAEVGRQLYGAGMMGPASTALGRSLDFDALDPHLMLNYGLSLQHQGRIAEAIDVFSAAKEVFQRPGVHQFLIYPLMFGDDGDVRHAAEAVEWGRRYAPAIGDGPLSNPAREGRKLNIGYLAPGFAKSQLRQFMAPLLENHDPQTVNVTLYPASAESEGDWPAWIRIRPIGDLDDAAAAALIRRDGIDILADCWGHTSGSRLAIFARRPAPVQVAWINFIQTTGLEQMDYVLHGDAAGATINGGLFTEESWPVGPVFNAFRPASGRLQPTPTPALSTGHVTFGSFNHPAKLSDPTVDAWGAVLRGAPTSRLLLKYRYFDDPVLQRATQARFAARGVAPERIVFAGHSKGEAYFASFRNVDLMLDAWPAPGSTTTLDALSNGVPVLAKPTPAVGGACVRAILEAAGLPELIATSPEDFVARALGLAADIPALDALRARVRPGFESGPCCDEAGFTRRVEAAFGEMFDRWRATLGISGHG